MTSQPQHAEQKHKATPQREPPSRDRAKHAAEVMEQPDLLALQRAVLDPAQVAPGDILGLQRTAGNRAVSRLIQAKLTVGGAGDRYEQEADRVAEQVVSGHRERAAGEAASQRPGVQRQSEEEEVQTKPLAATITPFVQLQEDEEEVQTKPLLQRQEDEEEVQTKPLLQRQEDEEEVQTKPLLQRRANADGSFDAGPSLETRLHAQAGGGSPLPDQVRGDMESRFGTSFGSVRVHTDAAAVQMNRALSAQAFTHGRDIYMSPDRYDPGKEAGKRLLAHELTHVIQQGGNTNRIARWGVGVPKPFSAHQGTSHADLTAEAVEDSNFDPAVKADYGPAALKYLGEHADHMDKRADYLIPVKKYMMAQKGVYKKKQGMYAGSELGKPLKKQLGKGTSLESAKSMIEAEEIKRAEDYDKAEGYNRNPAEAPNHAESGMYKAFGQEDGTHLRIKQYLTDAADQWLSGNPRQSLFTLALALHVAQDIGAHGYGRPGAGHDPRLFFPPPNQLAKTKWIYQMYGAGAHPEMGRYPDCFFPWCDNKDKNKHGWMIGKKQTWDILVRFHRAIGGGIGQGWKDPGWVKRNIRGMGRFLGARGIIKQ
jgi:Domain of unknown function (DUF4157)